MSRTVAVFLAVVALLIAAAPAQAAFPGQNGKIVFVRGQSTWDIWTMNPDGTGATRLTMDVNEEYDPAWSPDGKKIAFFRGSPNGGLSVMNADGSSVTRLTTASTAGHPPSWSPDGTKIAYSFGGIHVINADGTGQRRLTSSGYEPAWSPDGSKIVFHDNCSYCDEDSPPDAFAPKLWVINPDQSGYKRLTSSPDPDLPYYDTKPKWSPDGSRIAFAWDRTLTGPNPWPCGCSVIATVAADGTDRQQITGTSDTTVDQEPAWSPDGAKIVFERYDSSTGHTDIWVASSSGGDEVNLISDRLFDIDPDWQPIPVNAYPRPKSSNTINASLVPAFEPCTAPNRTHGPPLAFDSCAPPQQRSSQLTIGSPDSNGAPAKALAAVRYDVLHGNPATPADEADVRLKVAIEDVRNAALSDHVGTLSVESALRVTDKDNTPHPGGPGAATMSDDSFAFEVPCAATADASVGSTCSVLTTADAVLPGAVKERRRSIWELGAIEVHDGGGELFMTQGVYVP